MSLLSPVICTVLYVVLAISNVYKVKYEKEEMIKIQLYYILLISSYWFN